MSKHPTIENSKLENFPFKEGDTVLINWSKREPETATVHKLFVSKQWDVDVIYSILVKTDNYPKPFAVNHTLLQKITN